MTKLLYIATSDVHLATFHKPYLKWLGDNGVQVDIVVENRGNIECRVKEIHELGTHDMFIADVVAVHGDNSLMDEKNVFHLNDAGLIVYSHGTYFSLGESVGTFGFSVQKKKT